MAPSTSTPPKIKAEFTGVPETLMGILYARALDAKSPRPVLNDRHAARIVDKLDYDFSKMRIIPLKSAMLSLRAWHIDRWVADFLRQAPPGAPVTVLHLASGLDTRALRLAADHDTTPAGGSSSTAAAVVHWVDSDLPEVVDVRRRLAVPRPGGFARYEVAAADVTRADWLARLGLPRGHRTLVVAEGLSMYLAPEQGRAMVEQIAAYFVGEGNMMVFDMGDRTFQALARFDPIIISTGATINWAIDEPRELESLGQRLKWVGEASLGHEFPPNAPWVLRWGLWIASYLPLVGSMYRIVKYEW